MEVQNSTNMGGMKVKDLIQFLQNCDPESPIVITWNDLLCDINVPVCGEPISMIGYKKDLLEEEDFDFSNYENVKGSEILFIIPDC